jgi:lactoylglutathione lyase
MKVLKTLEESDRTTYWVGYIDEAPERAVVEREGLLKLIWIHGSELKKGQVYHNGNAEAQGFGHLGKWFPPTNSRGNAVTNA